MEDDAEEPPRYGLINRARKAFGGRDDRESIGGPRWEEDEAPADGQYAEPAIPQDIQIASSSNAPAVNVCITLFWWIWENWCGFTGYLSRQNPLGDLGLRFTAYMMAVTDIFEAFFSMVMRAIRILWQAIMWLWATLFRIVYVAGIPLPIVFWYLIGLLLLYLLNAYWQLVLTIIIDVVVPLLNLVITILNFLTLLITILLRIVFQIWNIFVPFIGMFIYVILDLVVTILQIVFDILTSDAFMNIIQAIFEIIFFLVDIAMQILMVFLQIGMPILQILAELLSFILEIIFVVIEVVLEILVWILDLLFKILEPILLIIQALCAAFSWMVAATSSFRMGRNLLSMEQVPTFVRGEGRMSGGSMNEFAETPDSFEYIDFVSSTYSQYARHVVYNSSSPHLTGAYSQNMEEIEDWFAESQQRHEADQVETPMDRVKRDLALRRASKESQELPSNFGQYTGRQLLETRKLKTRSAVGAGLEDDFSKDDEELPATKLDKTSEVFMSQFHTGVQQMVAEPTTNIDLMHHTLGRVRDHQRKGKDDLAIQSIMQRVAREHPELAGAPPGPAWARFRKNDPEHPHATHIRLKNERDEFAAKRGIPNTHRAYLEKVAEEKRIRNPAGGRALLEQRKGRVWMDDSHHQAASHLRNMEITHAQQIREQHNLYYEHHYNHVLATKTVFHGARSRMLHHAENTLHYDNFANHFQNILERHGYHSLKEAYDDFMKTHASAENFVLSLSAVVNMPGLSFLKQYDERRDTHPFFHDWHTAQREEELLREQAYGPTARKLLRVRGDEEAAAMNQQEDRPAGTGTSKEKFEGLEIISKTDCFSVPRNPLCMPEVPADLGEKLQIGEITIDERLKEDSDLCDPWMPDTNLLGWQRIVNGYHSIRFLISGFPPFNYLLTTFTLLVPWLAWMVDWVFLVPKGELASFAEIFCFFVSIYDLIIFIIFLRLVWWLLAFISSVFGGFVSDLFTARQRQNDYKEKIVNQRTNDPLLERQFRAYALLERERELLEQAEFDEEKRREQDQSIEEAGVQLNQQFIQFNLGGHVDHEHPLTKHFVRHIHAVAGSIDSPERHREIFEYYSMLLQLAFDLETESDRPVNMTAVHSSWKRLCKKYPVHLAPHTLPMSDVVIDDYDTPSHAASSSSSSSSTITPPSQVSLLPYLHPSPSEKEE